MYSINLTLHYIYLLSMKYNININNIKILLLNTYSNTRVKSKFMSNIFLDQGINN